MYKLMCKYMNWTCGVKLCYRMNRARKNKSDSTSKRKVLTISSASESIVLRRSKRNIKGVCKDQEEVIELPEVEKKSGSPKTADSSDCIVLNEIIVTESSKTKSPTKLITSTPVKKLHSNEAKVDEQFVETETGTCVGFSNSLHDVIVISDTSQSSLQVIEISDDETNECVSKGDVVEILPLNEEHEHKCKRLKLQEPNENFIVNNTNSKEEYPPLNKASNNRKRKRDFYMRRRRILKERSAYMNNRCNVNRKLKKLDVGENIYMENPIILPNSGLRPIIIDGSNVAFHHSNNSYFSCKGLDICIKYFKQRGHHVTAFVPQFRTLNNKSDNPKLLDSLVRKGDVILTPSRLVDGNPIISYDDRYIVQTAALKGGIIVTRDNYRDLLAENPAWSETIKYRLLQFTWVDDMLIFPKDPLGKNGPALDEFLKFG